MSPSSAAQINIHAYLNNTEVSFVLKFLKFPDQKIIKIIEVKNKLFVAYMLNGNKASSTVNLIAQVMLTLKKIDAT